MKPRMLMQSSALFMAILGIAASFLPQEIAARSGFRPDGFAIVLIQVTGALYLGFAILNWMARGNLIGGIYSRPVALGNFLHFSVAGIVLLKAMMTGQDAPVLVAGGVAYSAFGLWFGLILFTHPRQAESQGRW